MAGSAPDPQAGFSDYGLDLSAIPLAVGEALQPSHSVLPDTTMSQTQFGFVPLSSTPLNGMATASSKRHRFVTGGGGVEDSAGDIAGNFSKFLSSSILPFSTELLSSAAPPALSAKESQRQQRRKEEFNRSLQQLSQHVQRVVHTPNAEETISHLREQVAALEEYKADSEARYQQLFRQYQEQRQQNASLLLEVANVNEEISRSKTEYLAGSAFLASTSSTRRLTFDADSVIGERGAEPTLSDSDANPHSDSDSDQELSYIRSPDHQQDQIPQPIHPPPHRSQQRHSHDQHAHDQHLDLDLDEMAESSAQDLLQTSQDLESLFQHTSEKMVGLESTIALQLQKIHADEQAHARALAVVSAEKEALQAQLSAEWEKNRKLEDQARNADGSLLAQVEELSEQLQLKEEFADTIVKELANLKISSRNDLHRISQLEGQLGGWQLKHDTLERAAELLRQEISTLSREKEARDALVRSQEEELAFQKGLVSRLQSDHDDAVARVHSLDQSLHSAQRKLSQYEQDLSQSSAYRQNILSITSRLKDQISRAAVTTSSLQLPSTSSSPTSFSQLPSTSFPLPSSQGSFGSTQPLPTSSNAPAPGRSTVVPPSHSRDVRPSSLSIPRPDPLHLKTPPTLRMVRPSTLAAVRNAANAEGR